jgi:fatty acid desaturase
MQRMDIDTVFWRIFDKVKHQEELETSFVQIAGSVAVMLTVGVVGWFFWGVVSGVVHHCYGHETLLEKMERINRTKKQREQFVLKLSQELGYKDNWRKMYQDFENGSFRLKRSTVGEMLNDNKTINDTFH